MPLLLHRDDVPNIMVVDGENANIQGDFWRKLHDPGYCVNQTEHHTPNSNAAEGSMR
jgi:hypothetical protein